MMASAEPRDFHSEVLVAELPTLPRQRRVYAKRRRVSRACDRCKKFVEHCDLPRI